MISNRFLIALEACAEIARHPPEEPPLTVREIARRIGVSISYVEQIFADLRAAGIVRGVRGPGGGYRMVKKPRMIGVLSTNVAVSIGVSAGVVLGMSGLSGGGSGDFSGLHDPYDPYDAISPINWLQLVRELFIAKSGSFG